MRILEDTTDVGFVIAYRSSLQYLHRIFNLHLRCDLHQYQFSDIALEQYLGCSSRITDSDTEKRKMRIQEITARKAEDKNSKSDELANVTGKLDVMIKNGDTKINLKSLRWGRDHTSSVPQFKRPGLSSSVHAHRNLREEDDVVFQSHKRRSANTRTVAPQRSSRVSEAMVLPVMRKYNLTEVLIQLTACASYHCSFNNWPMRSQLSEQQFIRSTPKEISFIEALAPLARRKEEQVLHLSISISLPCRL